MKGKGFTFKKFYIDHSRCAMKVGTDGTLLGAWAEVPAEGRILDIGTGTGLIAIMVAQRTSSARITAIDIDPDCIVQARDNVATTEWHERIEVVHSSLQEFASTEPFNMIISNPPYFVDSLLSPDASRTTARHTETLSFTDLVQGVERLLAPDGRFTLILPPAEMAQFLTAARGRLYIQRRCEVWTTPQSGVRRIMAELSFTPNASPKSEKLIIEEHGPQGYSEEYKRLTRDFYLKF